MDNGVKLSIAGWKGVEVALAFGLTVTRLRGEDEAGGLLGENVQEAMSVKTQSTTSARRVWLFLLPLLDASLPPIPAT